MSDCAYAVFRPFPLTPKPAFLADPGGFLGAHGSSGWVNSCEEFVMCIDSSHILNSEVHLRATTTPDTTPNTIFDQKEGQSRNSKFKSETDLVSVS
ncbi:hypothetical protein HO173_010962 [Letharia columbiana]|uniref:Uncharacterized protein n=1 Tax=Letharia columbiana TaxID=112416 RepID=A0A8H6FLP6_9LECA|nr:uncharacterized protein HO173_010962 [Letharia columbiana]KAF6230846.1 hypothetical protein HO173_010962 [Letharia columbiana]